MNLFWEVVCITALAGIGGTGLGGVISCLFRKDSSRTVSLLLSFAGGVMTAVVCFDLLSKAVAPMGTADRTHLLLAAVGVMLGYAVIYLLNAWIDRDTNHEVAHIDENHPKTADSLEELIHADHYQVHEQGGQSHGSLFLAGLVMAAAIAFIICRKVWSSAPPSPPPPSKRCSPGAVSSWRSSSAFIMCRKVWLWPSP